MATRSMGVVVSSDSFAERSGLDEGVRQVYLGEIIL